MYNKANEKQMGQTRNQSLRDNSKKLTEWNKSLINKPKTKKPTPTQKKKKTRLKSGKLGDDDDADEAGTFVSRYLNKTYKDSFSKKRNSSLVTDDMGLNFI